MKTIGIIGAMPSELSDIRLSLGQAAVEEKASFKFFINEFEGKRLVNVCCGIGKVNAALCTQNLIDCYKPDYIINTGIAGGMNPEVKVCDIVVSSEVMYHDLLTRFLENYPPYNGIFKADAGLIQKAIKSCEKYGIKCFPGRIVSGEAFVSDSVLKARIIDEFSPFAVDMESAGIGHCAFLNNVPFVSVRCISDNADDEGEMSFEQFEKIAAKRVAEIVLDMAKEI